MRHLAPLAVVYLLVAALIVPASPFAAEDEAQKPAEDGAGTAETTPGATAPSAPPPPQAPSEPPAAPQPPATGEPPPVEQPPAPQPDAPAEATPGKPVARAAAPGSVTIKDFSFGPASVTVNVGERVTWSNSGPSAHTATAGDGSFDTGLLSRGQSRSIAFRKAGTFSYICTPHPNMKGTVRVVAASSGGGGGGSGSSAGSTGAGDVEDQGSTAGSTGAGEVGGSGAALPKSGAEAEALAVLGLLLLLLGASARRRVAG